MTAASSSSTSPMRASWCAQEVAQPQRELAVHVEQADIAGQVEGEKVGVHTLGQPRDPEVHIRDAHLEVRGS